MKKNKEDEEVRWSQGTQPGCASQWKQCVFSGPSTLENRTGSPPSQLQVFTLNIMRAAVVKFYCMPEPLCFKNSLLMKSPYCLLKLFKNQVLISKVPPMPKCLRWSNDPWSFYLSNQACFFIFLVQTVHQFMLAMESNFLSAYWLIKQALMLIRKRVWTHTTHRQYIRYLISLYLKICLTVSSSLWR